MQVGDRVITTYGPATIDELLENGAMVLPDHIYSLNYENRTPSEDHRVFYLWREIRKAE